MTSPEGPMVEKRPDETPIEAARRRLNIDHPGVWFNLLEVWPLSPKSWDIEFWEGHTVYVVE